MDKDNGGYQKRSPLERLVIVEEKAQAFHQRVDKFEVHVKDQLGDMKDQLSDMQSDIKILLAHFNQGIGRTTFIVSISTLLGGAGGFFAERIFQHFFK